MFVASLLALSVTSVAVAVPATSAAPPARHDVTVWVHLADRERGIGFDPSISPRALQRRIRRGVGTELRDSDRLVSPSHVAALVSHGATVRVESRWLNAVSVRVDRERLAAMRELPFVKGIEPVRVGRRAELLPVAPPVAQEGGVAGSDYGASLEQLAQIDLPALHARGFRGEGIVIGVLDTGFNRVHQAFASAEHPLDVIAEWDFINNDPNTGIERGDPSNQHRHGTWILGTLAAYAPGTLVGAAYEASFILAKTEAVPTETPIEEDYYVAGLEFIEAQGADIATSSLGYIDWYTQEDLDGASAVTTIAVNIATSKGLICLTAAGNAGHDEDPGTSHLVAPGDALEVITCGAVDATGATAGFSSDGPTADGRIKPELLARGVATATVHSTNATGVAALNGTSLSTPLVAGALACILEARPELGVGALREALFATATEPTSDPLFVRGYGILQADDAASFGRNEGDLNLDGTVNSLDLALLLGAWGGCAACEACPFDLDGDCEVGASDLSLLLGGWEGGSTP
jgi:subtilisin family serine protease